MRSSCQAALSKQARAVLFVLWCRGMRPGDAGWDDLWDTPCHGHTDASIPPLMFGGESFACPKITFASGFAEYVGRGWQIIFNNLK